MEHICQNCNRPIQENFCGNCGQKNYKRIDRKYILDEIQYTLIHTNKGFLYSVKKILKNPGKTAREFIYGNRVNHYKPILLSFLLSTISAFLSFKVIGLNEIMKELFSRNEMYSDFMNKVFSFSASYNSFIILLLIPILAIFTSIAFIRWGQNYYEHVIMNAYFLCFYTLVNIILIYPLMYIFKGNIDVIEHIFSASFIVTPFLLFWFYRGFYKDKAIKHIILRILLFFLMVFIGYMLLIVLFAISFILFYGKDAIQHLQPK